jgi:hypothetical protein
MNVAVTILGKVRDDCTAGAVLVKPHVLVVEGVRPVAHQVASPGPLEEVAAVLALTQQRVELEVQLVVVARGVVEDDTR